MYLITSAIGGTFGLIFLVIWVLLSIYSLFNVLRNKNMNGGAKILWVVIIIVVPILGSIAHLPFPADYKDALSSIGFLYFNSMNITYF